MDLTHTKTIAKFILHSINSFMSGPLLSLTPEKGSKCIKRD